MAEYPRTLPATRISNFILVIHVDAIEDTDILLKEITSSREQNILEKMTAY
jgi:hypothetical protein